MSKPLVQAVWAAVLGVALAALVGVSSGQVKSTAKAMALTPLDYVEIQQLVSRYAFAVDTGNNNGYDYADLFAADGEFMRPYAKGREQLAALARGGRLGPNNTVHYIMNHVIEPTADGAIGKEYLIELNWEITPAQAASGRGAGRTGPPATGGGGRRGPVNHNSKGGRTCPHRRSLRRHLCEDRRRLAFQEARFHPVEERRRPGATAAAAYSGSTAQPAAGPLPPAANFIPPTLQSSLTAMDYIQIAQLVELRARARLGLWQGRERRGLRQPVTDAAFAGAEGHDNS